MGVTSILEFISIGKYQQGLFHNKRLQHSSVWGGLLTIALGILFLTYSISQLILVFQQKNYNVDTSIEDLIKYEGFLETITVGNFEPHFIE